jgi:hypothetical protein
MILGHKLSIGKFHRTALSAALLGVCLLTGCKSKMDKAVEQAKQQAAATGQAQQVISTDDSGTTTTTVVQPPAPGQTTQQVTTTTSSSKSVPVSGSAPPAPAPGAAPVVSAYNGAAAGSPAPVMSDGSSAPPAPTSAPAPGGPVVSPVNIHVPAGTSLAIRINQRISVKTSRAGERFSGEVEAPVTVAGSDNIVIPRGTHVDGVIVEAHRRGHFKGRSILELRLVSMTLNGQRYPLNTHDLTQTKKGKGKRSAAFIGGGTGLGMLIGGVATGGVGLLVGGAVGAGTGTALGGLTGNRDIVIPAESVVNFRLADDLVIQPA